MASEPDLNMESQDEIFSRISAREQRKIFVYIFSLLPNAMDAEEVLQNTNLVLWKKFDEFDRNSNFFLWASRVAYFEVLKFRSRRKRDSLVFGTSFLEDVSVEVMDQFDVSDRRLEALQACLERLQERDRQIILARYSENATTQSVALQMARSVKSTYATITRIRESLLECITRRLKAEDRS